MPADISAIAELSSPTHACLIYKNPQDRVDVISEYLARGLTRGELCVFLESPRHLESMRKALASSGVNVTEEENRGALILSDNVDFLEKGHFNGKRTIHFLDEITNRAIQQ
jgi:hypothetical protein